MFIITEILPAKKRGWHSRLGKLYENAVNFLAVRPRSILETRRYLKQKIWKKEPGWAKEESEEAVEGILVRLGKEGFLNDERFARWWVNERKLSPKGRGVKLIQQELLSKGIESKLIDLIFDQEIVLADQLEKAKKVFLQKAKLIKAKNPYELRGKMAAFLQRRGFEMAIIKKVLQDLDD